MYSKITSIKSRHFAWQPSAGVPQNSRPTYLGLMITGTTYAEEFWHLQRSDCIHYSRTPSMRQWKSRLFSSYTVLNFSMTTRRPINRSQWRGGQRPASVAVRFLALWVRIPLGGWMFVSCERCVLLGRGLCVGLITLLSVVCLNECELEASVMKRPWTTERCCAIGGVGSIYIYKSLHTAIYQKHYCIAMHLFPVVSWWALFAAHLPFIRGCKHSK
jgi:hypothetical protein